MEPTLTPRVECPFTITPVDEAPCITRREDLVHFFSLLRTNADICLFLTPEFAEANGIRREHIGNVQYFDEKKLTVRFDFDDSDPEFLVNLTLQLDDIAGVQFDWDWIGKCGMPWNFLPNLV